MSKQKTFLLLLVLLNSASIFAQQTPKQTKKNGFYYVEIDTGILEEEPERGALLKAYYASDTLKKISCWYGFNFGDLRRDFYYFNDKLIMVTEEQRLYAPTGINAVKGDTVTPNYYGRYLFDQGKIKSIKQDGSFSFMNTPADKLSMQNTFVMMSNQYKQMAEDTRSNKKNRKKIKKSHS